jgi:hypothetical protein
MDPGSSSSPFMFSDMEFALALLRHKDTEICARKLAELLSTSDIDAVEKQWSQFNEKYLISQNKNKQPHSDTPGAFSEDMNTHSEMMKKIERLLETPIGLSLETINSRK